MADRPKASSLAVSRRMKATRRRDTPGELAVRSELHRRGFRFRVDTAPIRGARRRADIVFTRQRVAVYIDGCFWHGCPQHGTWPQANADWWRSKIEANQKRDRESDAELTAHGWRVVRLWTHEDARAAVRRVADALDQARGRDDASSPPVTD